MRIELHTYSGQKILEVNIPEQMSDPFYTGEYSEIHYPVDNGPRSSVITVKR
jgi:hypothetical protein